MYIDLPPLLAILFLMATGNDIRSQAGHDLPKLNLSKAPSSVMGNRTVHIYYILTGQMTFLYFLAQPDFPPAVSMRLQCSYLDFISCMWTLKLAAPWYRPGMGGVDPIRYV
jgi:hypothetical protein